MKSVLKIGLGIVLGFTILVAGCTAIVGAGMESASNDRGQGNAQMEANVSKLHEGQTKAEVVRIMGQPESVDTTAVAGSTMEVLEWDEMVDGHYVTVTLDDGVVSSVSNSKF
jgi:hypothetical protein